MVNTAIKMSRTLKYVLFAIGIVVLATSFFVFKEYNRKLTDLTHEKPQEKITASALIAAFKNDEENANKIFLGKTLMITGFITEINNEQDTLLNIFLGEKNTIEKVSCIMDMRRKDSFVKLMPGQQISIIGFCTGYLQDVEMNRCVIAQSK